MKLIIPIVFFGVCFSANSQTFDALVSNGSNKKIEWTTSNWESGFGHKIFSYDPGGKTLLNIASRHNNSNWTNLMSFTSNGLVGIGTANPSTKFHVIDGAVGAGINQTKTSVKFEIGRQKLELKSVRTANEASWNNTTLKLLAIIDNTDHQSIDFVNDSNFKEHIDILTGNQKFNSRFTADGSLGIGTKTVGSHKLAVEGSIGAREIKVEANGWSDFVFEENYNLPTLKQVESHIKKKGHLQDIPSAKEVKENGINLGEMDSKLLQKIEELMLYTIQQQKEIEKLKEQIALFKK